MDNDNKKNNKNNKDESGASKLNWYPGHMLKAIREIKERLKLVDIVLEIRDARSPLVTGNSSISLITGEKNRLIVINKSNLADPKIVKAWEAWFSQQNTPFVFINCMEKSAAKKIIQLAREIVNKRRLQSNPECLPAKKLKMMIIGLPNTGKSTIINKLANRSATKVADKPGETKHQLWVKVSEELELLDTPGVMPPKIDTAEEGLWLSALNAIPENVIDAESTGVYVVQHLLKIKSVTFKEHYKIDSFELDLGGALQQIAKSRGCIRAKNECDYERVYKIILNDFRSGSLGRVSFGLPPAFNF